VGREAREERANWQGLCQEIYLLWNNEGWLHSVSPECRNRKVDAMAPKLALRMGALDFISETVACQCGSQAEIYPSIMTAFRFIALAASCLALTSCDNMKKSGSSDPYASNYGNDGHYNPYPGQTGYATTSAPKYQTPPAPTEPAQPEPAANPYAFAGSKKTTPSISSATPKKTVASSASAKKKSTPTKSTAKKSTGSKYTVVKGDTLSGIARRKGTTVAKLKSANGLSGDLIRLGQSLKIP